MIRRLRRRLTGDGTRPADAGSAIIEFVFVAVVVLVPLVYVVVAAAAIQRNQFAVSQAARDAGRAYATSDSAAQAAPRAEAAARIVLHDAHLDDDITVRFVAAGRRVRRRRRRAAAGARRAVHRLRHPLHDRAGRTDDPGRARHPQRRRVRGARRRLPHGGAVKTGVNARSRPGRSRCRVAVDDRGSTLPLIIGFFLIAMLMVAGSVAAGDAFVQQRGLQDVCDGAALAGAASAVDLDRSRGVASGGTLRFADVQQVVDAYLARDPGRADVQVTVTSGR